MSDETEPESASPTPHRRRPRYSGKNPRKFAEKYKEHAPEKYADTVAKVLASGKTPAGAHRPIMVAEILQVLDPQPRQIAAERRRRGTLRRAREEPCAERVFAPPDPSG